MRRRDIIVARAVATAALGAGGLALGQAFRPRRVAFMITPGHNVIDLAGNSPRLVAILKNLRELSTLYITHSLLAVPDRAGQMRVRAQDQRGVDAESAGGLEPR